MPEQVDLGFAVRLPPRDAIAYFKSKGYAISWNWFDTRDEAHAQAFTTAKVVRADVLQDLRTEMQRVLDEGATERDFIRRLEPRLKAKGWWGKVIVVSPDERAQIVQQGSPHRLRTIYQTNLHSALNAGRFKAQMEGADGRPYWMYTAVMDARTRPSHAALHNKIFRFDDPIWRSIYPPNGFNCRCRVRALSETALRRRGGAVESSEGHLSEQIVDAGVDRDTGEIIQKPVTVWRGKDRLGRDAVFRTDPGWNYNPGEAAFGRDAALMRKLTLVEDQAIRSQAIQALNNAPLRQAQFARWVDEALPRRGAGHSAQTLHLMSERVAEFVRSHGAEPARVLAMNERTAAHVDSPKHWAGGIALTREELRRLPAVLASPLTNHYWDRKHRNLLYAYPASDGETIIVPVTTERRMRRVPGRLDQVVNAFKIRDRRLATDKRRFERMP